LSHYRKFLNAELTEEPGKPPKACLMEGVKFFGLGVGLLAFSEITRVNIYL
jgi:hypothetical protein